jgi:hypothetical protein
MPMLLGFDRLRGDLTCSSVGLRREPLYSVQVKSLDYVGERNRGKWGERERGREGERERGREGERERGREGERERGKVK